MSAWELSPVTPPWGARPSLYEHIRGHLKADGSGLSDAGEALPDEAPAKGGVQWAAGALDGVLGHHVAEKDAKAAVEGILEVLRAVTASDAALASQAQVDVEALYAAAKAGSVLGFVDSLLGRIRDEGALVPQRVHAVGLWLATQAPEREPVKLGLALLGLFGREADQEVLLTLGAHEEFTLFAAVALARASPEPDAVLWKLAKQVTGWGRIQTVQRLAKTTRPEIKNWLLREGFRNAVMHEYLAYTCAVAGGLASALAAEAIDVELLTGAGEILSTLIYGQGGPAEGIDDYADSAAVITSYLRHAERQAKKLRHFLDLESVQDFLSDEERWTAPREGWSPELRPSLLAQVTAILSRPEWRERVLQALDSADRVEFWTATSAAKVLGIDTWERFFQRVSAGQDYWFQLMETRDPRRMEQALELAGRMIPLAEIATGAAEEMGFGPGFVPHRRLDSVLQALAARFPGKGWPFIEAGLKSPVVRNRNLAIRALAGWDRTAWPETAKGVAWECASREPNKDVRAAFAKLLGS